MPAELGPAKPSLQIRRMTLEDVPVVRDILQQAPEAADWSVASIRTLLEGSQTLALVSIRAEQISGCIFGARIDNQAEILNLAVLPIHRRKGDGSNLVRALIAEWELHSAPRIFLEVRESNAGAIKLYEGIGFQQAGRRKKYYSAPEEDALVLAREGVPQNPQVGTS